jgi:hypothetical protein
VAKATKNVIGDAAGTAVAHAVCSPLLPAAAWSAAKCAINPFCPK